MLTEITIRNFAIIDELRLELGGGFVVLTGETGAGKSIIIDAVEVLLGGRAEESMVRQGSDTAIIEAEFRFEREEVQTILVREQLLEDHSYVRLAREIRRGGRNVARVNGRTVTNSLLQEIGKWLVDVHGQSEHLSLLRLPEHIRLLDRFVGLDSSKYQQVFDDQHAANQHLEELRSIDRESTQRAEFLKFQLNEIEAARLVEEEDGELLEEHRKLANAEQLARLIDQGLKALSQDGGQASTASERMSEAMGAVEEIASIDPSMLPVRDEAQVLLESIAELGTRLRIYSESVEHNPKRLETVEQRLALLRDLQRKYGDSIPAILAHAEESKRELQEIEGAEEQIEILQGELSQLRNEMRKLGEKLTEERAESASSLSAGIEKELSDLGMEGAGFEVSSEWKEDEEGLEVDSRRIAVGRTGFDHIEFLVAPNPGEGLKSLRKIASGGETSRLMLAMKGVLAQADQTPTLIFDEIDQGIGGRVGAIVGSKLWDLARSHQVLCITHLPQLAAFADTHIKVEKQVDAGRTQAMVAVLQGEERIGELAIMLGSETKTNRDSALELLNTAAQAKSAPALVEV
jgi:DNA repair protein RecN (Recombination protein N)